MLLAKRAVSVAIPDIPPGPYLSPPMIILFPRAKFAILLVNKISQSRYSKNHSAFKLVDALLQIPFGLRRIIARFVRCYIYLGIKTPLSTATYNFPLSRMQTKNGPCPMLDIVTIASLWTLRKVTHCATLVVAFGYEFNNVLCKRLLPTLSLGGPNPP